MMKMKSVKPANCSSGFVYLWTNNVNGKKYLGSHIGAEDDGYIGSGTAFKRAWKKYGSDAFSRTIIEGAIPVTEVREREQYYIDLFLAASSREFYNMRAQVGGGFEFINNHPDVSIFRKKQSDSTKKRILENGHPRGMLGKTHTPETKNRMSSSIRQSLVSLRGVKVFCFDYDANLIAEYDSIAAAAKSVSGSPSNIKYACEGRFAAVYDYVWSYNKNQCLIIDRSKTGVRKKVKTPIGEFTSISAAAKAHNINPLTLKRWIAKSVKGFSWL